MVRYRNSRSRNLSRNTTPCSTNVLKNQGRIARKIRYQTFFETSNKGDSEYLFHYDDVDDFDYLYDDDNEKKKNEKSSDVFTSISDNASVLQQENEMEEEDVSITMQLYHLMLAEEENEASSTSFNQNNNVSKVRVSKDDTKDGDNKFSNVMESILLEDNIKLQNEDDNDISDNEWTTIDDENNSFVGVCCKDKVVETVQQGISTNSKVVDEWSVVSNVPSVYSTVSELPTSSSSIISMNSDSFTFTYSDALRFGHQQKNNNDEKINPLPEEDEEADYKNAIRFDNNLEISTSSKKKCISNNANNNDYDDCYDADFIRDGVKYGHGGGVKFLSTKKIQKKEAKREQA